MNSFVDSVCNRDVTAVQNMLEAGADPNLQDEQTGESVLALAATTGDAKLVQFLLEYGADPNSLETTSWPLSNAAVEGHVSVVERLLEADAEVDSIDEDGCTALGDAAAGGFLEIVELLLEAGANPRRKDYNGSRPIILAAENGHEDVVERLATVSTPRDRQQANLLLKLSRQGPPTDDVKEFFKAAESGDIEAVKAYLAAGGSVDAMAEDGRTATFGAARRGRVDVLELLLQHGADMNHIDGYGSYPLATAGQKSGNRAYEFVYEHTNEKLRKDWARRVEEARRIAKERGYL